MVAMATMPAADYDLKKNILIYLTPSVHLFLSLVSVSGNDPLSLHGRSGPQLIAVGGRTSAAYMQYTIQHTIPHAISCEVYMSIRWLSPLPPQKLDFTGHLKTVNIKINSPRNQFI